MTITLWASDGTAIWQGKTSQLVLKEQCILDKSIEIYDDPEPCMIHRGAIMMLLFQLIEKELEKCDKKPINQLNMLVSNTELPEKVVAVSCQ